MNRRWGILSALLATALLLYAMPGLLGSFLSSTGRTDDRLKKPQARTMVVWVTSWLEEDRKVIAALCSAFEQQTPGLRIYLRRADAAELYSEDAVLPDVVLHTTGDILAPGEVLIPITAPGDYPEEAARAGGWQGRLYALPLWYAPNVLSLPAAWLMADDNKPTDGSLADAGGIPEAGSRTDDAGPQTALLTPSRQEPSYFGTQAGETDAELPTLTADTLPWARLLAAGSLDAQETIGLSQLMLLCPNTLRRELSGLTVSMPEDSVECAAIRSLSNYQTAREGRVAMALPVVTSQRVRYVSLCRGGEDGAAFVRFLLGSRAADEAMAVQLAPVCGDQADTPQEPLLRETLALAESGLMLPNTFLMGIGELESLCRQDFASAADPVSTLLKLR